VLCRAAWPASDHEIAAQLTVARKLGRLGDPFRPYRSVAAWYR
jgi:hypothetical protein